MFEKFHSITFQKNKVTGYSIQESSLALVIFKGYLGEWPLAPVNLLSAPQAELGESHSVLSFLEGNLLFPQGHNIHPNAHLFFTHLQS